MAMCFIETLTEAGDQSGLVLSTDGGKHSELDSIIHHWWLSLA